MHKSLLFELIRERQLTPKRNDIKGTLYLNGVAICFTLEHRTYAIPTGLYTVEYSNSPKFGRHLPLVCDDINCPESRGIRIHAGNSIEDTKGCILVGLNAKTVGNNPYSTRLLESKSALDMICKIIELNPKRPIALLICEE